ncbi:hypothetical protein [Mesorhizobium jarvisii]|uniref:hypothetical protein n=1 Tax=Mesorhizobium jarvisii TaxID=1777867 RepID=UPI001316A321|nr:hypothetical protein [Mesorhizobium jarvisii]MCH4558636.1 hypothetical protein [Mesorhizobium jarvisii]QGU20681.1 hypothetical protein MCHK_09105 [Mesorhizobium huakuii 7653R]
MITKSRILAGLSSISVLVSACGIRVPDIQEFGDSDAQSQMVQSIVHNINCELRDYFSEIYSKRSRTYFDDWGVQSLLSLTIAEKVSVSPSANWMPHGPVSTVFNLSGGGSLSSEATRIDKLNTFNTVKELRDMGPCDSKGRPGGFMLMQSDLKLRDWLYDTLAVQETRQGNFDDKALTKDVVFHEIKFVVSSTGEVSPAWKLTRATINNTGTLFSTNRDRTHDLQITLGPTDRQDPGPGKVKPRGPPRPGFTAANTALSGDIAASVASGIKRGLEQ